jgi:Planctomycete cytochrome C
MQYMKKLLWTSAAFLTILTILSIQPACYYDNEEELYGNNSNSCDTVNMRYSVHIKPLIESQCNSCHKEGAASYSGISLDAFNKIKLYVNTGDLIRRINSKESSQVMPPTGQMPLCDRQTIEAWVKAGALNN